MNLISRGALQRGGTVWLGVYGLILAGWVGLILMARASDTADLASGLPDGFWASLCVSAAGTGFGTLFLMWALMAGAMMLPSFVPMLRTYMDLFATGAADTRGAIALVGGYLGVWMAGAALGAVAQAQLAQAALVAPHGASVSGWLNAGLLALAGLYQFSRLKEACLSRCRMPLSYFMGRWRPGARRALAMGAELGVVCFGCCWALMALAFVGGTMNVLWMAALTVLMSLEKLPDLGRPLTRPLGYILIAAGASSAGLAAMG